MSLTLKLCNINRPYGIKPQQIILCHLLKIFQMKHYTVSYRFSSITSGNRREQENVSNNQTPTTSVKGALTIVQENWKEKLKSAGVTEARESVDHILAHVLKLNKAIVSSCVDGNIHLTEEQLNEVDRLCECRLARMPLQYVIQEWDFRDLTLRMAPPVFIPRPETEVLVDLALQKLKPGSQVLEVGCGSGAISLSILKSCPQTRCLAVDQSLMACQLTKDNAVNLGLTKGLRILRCKLQADGDLLGVENEEMDLIISNPPYVPRRKLSCLQPEIRLYEDLRALDGGMDGMDIIKSVLILSSKWLKQGGHVLLEVDKSHPPLIEQWLKESENLHLSYNRTYKDFSDCDRFVEITKL